MVGYDTVVAGSAAARVVGTTTKLSASMIAATPMRRRFIMPSPSTGPTTGTHREKTPD
jgi:hypothetical protein